MTTNPASGSPVTAEQERWLTPGVRGIGAASFLADVGHEIPTALLPNLLTTTRAPRPPPSGSSRASLTGWLELHAWPAGPSPTARGVAGRRRSPATAPGPS